MRGAAPARVPRFACGRLLRQIPGIMKTNLLILTLALGASTSLLPAQDNNPPRDEKRPPPREGGPGNARGGRHYSIEQAVSDRAQLHTIAFDGLAFFTGDFACDTFLPPGKVSDYFGFQYMRDIDAKEGGHNTSFLTRIAHNMLAVLNDEQKSQLLVLGKIPSRRGP